ncbi:PKD domain-containing protein [Beggiatoa leptomitoformis]|uniref:PKD domain-containing protein n=1 Tax=Beggiatoa leptomitoformis TaxID=288004 RepID=A0A2N9YDP4_9GAMM|nr:PKD domain-containing protein [Beggiatoa leptomitoformis]ALG69102.1 PKD domain-containing protein [Beggiatoa leptomitoformis]AUI68485.1 PKD domain-containing protein [Beggiatoa leptomitoformis]
MMYLFLSRLFGVMPRQGSAQSWGVFLLQKMSMLLVLGMGGFPLTSYAVLQLHDGQNFVYDVEANGVLAQGSFNAYANMYRLRVNNANYLGQVTQLSTDGREAYLASFTEPASGLQVERRIYVPKTGQFARYMEVVGNPTSVTKTVDIEISGTLGSGNNTQVLDSRSNYLMTQTVVNGVVVSNSPILLHYHSQAGGAITATHSLSGGQLSWTYAKISIPANSQRRIIYFVAQAGTAIQATDIATYIAFNPSSLYENIVDTIRGEIVNFTPPSPNANTDFSSAIALSNGELRQGSLEETDTASHQRAGTPADGYLLNLAKDETVTLTAAAGFNTYLYLFDDIAGKTVLASNDDKDKNTQQSEIVFTAPATKTYYIEVTAFNRQERGTYSLNVQSGKQNKAPQAYDFVITGQNSTAPATVTFTDFSHDSDGSIVKRCWQFGDGSPSQCTTGNSISYTYTSAGQYSVGVTVTDNDNLADTQTAVVKIIAPVEGIVLPLANIVSGELSTADTRSRTRVNALTDRYVIAAPNVGEELVLEMSSERFDSYLYLYDQYNRLVRQDDNSGGGKTAKLRYAPTYAGNLYVEATSYDDNQLGFYSLSLQKVSAATTVNVVLEASTMLNNPLQNLFVARLPDSFKPTFLLWNFGDNSATLSTDEAIASHTYSRTGTYTVSVIANNANGEVETGSKTFFINSQVIIPQSHFSATPLFGEIPLPVFFSNQSSTTLSGDTLRYIWDFGDGQIATDSTPNHTFTAAGAYQTVLRTYSTLTQQSNSYTVPITVIDRASENIAMTGITRLRPQVLMGGLDPMLVDLLDTDLKVFAIIRTGSAKIQTVRLLQNGSDYSLSLQHVATYSNGDQRYEAMFPLYRGLFPAITLGELFGAKTGQFRIQADDISGQFHAFPNLELGSNPPLSTAPTALKIEPIRALKVRRHQAQVLAAGFDPALVNTTDSQFTVKAIVREGISPIESVVLQQNQGTFALSMRLLETLPDGDYLYGVAFAYPQDSFSNVTLGNIWSNQASAEFFSVIVTDKAGYTHRYPELKIGNYPVQ